MWHFKLIPTCHTLTSRLSSTFFLCHCVVDSPKLRSHCADKLHSLWRDWKSNFPDNKSFILTGGLGESSAAQDLKINFYINKKNCIVWVSTPFYTKKMSFNFFYYSRPLFHFFSSLLSYQDHQKSSSVCDVFIYFYRRR